MVHETENSISLPLLFPKIIDECEICGETHKIENCTFLDATIEHVYDTPTPSYAHLSLPQGLEIRNMVGRKSVYTTVPFAKGIQFGPVIAKTSTLMDIRVEFPLKVFLSEEDSVYLETYEEEFCNWLGFISAANNYEEQNLICYQIKTSIYFCTLRNIKEGQELKAWYAPYYAEKMGMSPYSKLSDMVHSSDEEYKDIFESLQNGVCVEENNFSLPKKKRRRKFLRKPMFAEHYVQGISSNDLLPGELLGARERREEWHCQECDQVETSVAAYARHLMSHNRASKPPFACPYCPRRFKKDGYNRNIHLGVCKAEYEKKQKGKGISAKLSSLNGVTGVNGDYITFPSCNPDREMSQIIETVGHFPFEISCTLISQDKGKPGVIENNHSSCNTEEDVAISKTDTHVNGYSEEGNILEHISNPLDFTHQNGASIVSMRIETQNRSSGINIENRCWSDARDVGSKNAVEQETLNANEHNDTNQEKVPDPISNNINSEPLSENGATQCHLNAPILDLSDDIDFNITKSFVDIISEDSTLEKSALYSKVNKSFGFGYDFAPNMEVEPQVSTLDSSTFYSQEKTSFLPSSFTACDDVTDEERNRIVESFLSDAHDKYHSTEYIATSDDCMEHSSANINIDSERKPVDTVKGSRRNRPKKFGDFKCEICGKCFQMQKYLYRHLRKHTGDFKCNLCFRVFSRKETLVSHKPNCELEAPTQQTITHIRISCKYCKLQFHSLDSLQTHMAIHFCKGDTWKCSCGIVSDNIALLTTHPCNQDRKVSCERCHEIFATAKAFVDHKTQVIKHRKRVRKDLSALCEFCGLIFKTYTGVRLHRRIHGDKKFECNICDKKFFRKDAMMKHKLHHEEPKWECSVCLKKFTTRKILKTHVETLHLHPEFNCPDCDKSFGTEGGFKKHMNIHKAKLVFNCKYCNIQFTDKETYKKHQSEAHFCCSLCHKQFCLRSALNRHIQTEHLQRYKCSFCYVVYRYRQTLKNHLMYKHKDRVDEWNSPEALMAMVYSVNEGEIKQLDKSNAFPSKDILQTAADIVMNPEHLDLEPDEEAEEIGVEAKSSKNNEESPSLQMVKFNLESVSASGSSEVIGLNREDVFNVPLSFIEDFRIADQTMASSSQHTQCSINLDTVQEEAEPGESERTDRETRSSLTNNENNADLQLVTLNLRPLSNSGISEMTGSNAEDVFNVSLTYIENLQITDESVTSRTSPTPHLPVFLDSVQGDSNVAVDNAVVNFPLNLIPKGYQLALNDSSAEKPPTEGDAVLVNVEDLQEADGFILSDGSIVQPNLTLENNVLFYVLDSSAANSLP